MWWTETPAHQPGFEAYVAQVFALRLKHGRVVQHDNLPARKGERAKELLDEKNCELLYLPPY